VDTNIALTIIGSVMTVIGVVFIAIPKVVNEKTMNDLPSEAVNISALFRAANGGLGLALGMVAIYARNLPTEYAETILLSLGTGFILVNMALLSGKIRGFGDELPVPPMVIFLVLTILAYYTALG
tara:strand:+ start:362 stop:736 length:375 start_codon:yes stop_codon:yes gene_type:complete